MTHTSCAHWGFFGAPQRRAVSLFALTLAGILASPLSAADLQASPAAVRFTFERGGNLPEPQPVILTSSGDPLPWSVAFEDAPWLSLNAGAGSTPASLVLSVDPSSLAAGAYSASLVFRAPRSGALLLRLPVTLTVANPSVSIDAESIDFDVPPGSAPAARTASITVRRTTPGLPVDFTASASPAPWLSIQTVTGATPGSIRLTANPAGLAEGLYTAELSISAPQAGASFIVPVRLNVRPRPVLLPRPPSLTFSYQAGAGNQRPATVQVSGAQTPFRASATTADWNQWLAVNPPAAGVTPGSLQAAIQPEHLDPATYRGSILLDGPSATAATVPVSLHVTTLASPVAEPASLAFEAPAGSTLPLSQPLHLATNGAILPVSLAANGFPWLSVSQRELTLGALDPVTMSVYSDPRTIIVGVDPSGLDPGSYRGSIVVTPSNGADSAIVPVTLTIRPNRLLAPQVADGAGWQTTFLLVNADRDAARFQLRFFAPDGTPLPLPVDGAGTLPQLSGAVPANGLQVVTTPGLGDKLLQGWAEITSTRFLGGAVIFRQRTPAGDSEAALSLLPPPSGPLSMPFDNSEGFSTAFALLNAGPAATSAQLTLRDENGNLLLQDALSLAAGARQAFSLPDQYPQTARRRGVLSISASAPGLAAFGLRFNPRASFTSLQPAATPSASGTVTSSIPQVADAAGWKTTILLSNPGSQPVPFSLSFHKPDGSPLQLPLLGAGLQSEYADTVPPGGVRILQTAGTSYPLAEGSAELVSGGPLTGVAVFRQRASSGQDTEGALGVASSALRAVLPFDNTGGFQTALAVVNAFPSSTAPIALLLRDEAGRLLATSPLLPAQANRYAFRLSDLFPAARDHRGTVELTGAGFAAFALRFNPAGSFTTIEPIVK